MQAGGDFRSLVPCMTMLQSAAENHSSQVSQDICEANVAVMQEPEQEYPIVLVFANCLATCMGLCRNQTSYMGDTSNWQACKQFFYTEYPYVWSTLSLTSHINHIL